MTILAVSVATPPDWQVGVVTDVAFAGATRWQTHPVRMSHFWTLMNDEFGADYAATLARDHVLGSLGGRTVNEALEQGEPPRAVWDALCDDMDVPAERRLGRNTRVARGAQGGQLGGKP